MDDETLASRRLGKLLASNHDAMVEEWHRRVLQELPRPVTARMPAPYLLDQVPDILLQLGTFFETFPAPAERPLNLYHGEGYTHPAVRGEAGYQAQDVVAELTILRSVIYTYLERDGAPISLRVNARLNSLIDAAIYSVSSEFDELRRTSEKRATDAVLRISTLERVASAALQGTRVEQVFDAVLREIQIAFDADAVTFLLAVPGEDALQVRSSVGIPRTVGRSNHVPFGKGFAGRIYATGKPWRLEDVGTVECVRPDFIKSMASILGVPLRYENRVLGVVHVATEAKRAFSAEDEVFLQLLSDRIAVAVAHAELYEAESKARERADEERRRVRMLYETSAALISLADVDSMLQKVAELAVGALGDWCLIDLVEQQGLRNAAGVHRDAAKQQWLTKIGGRASRHDPRSLVVRCRRPVVLRRLADKSMRRMAIDTAHYQALTELGLQSLIVVPLLARDRALGTLAFGRGAGQPFNTDDLSLANEIGRQIGLALDNALLVDDLRSAVRGREEILAVVSHDLRNPLSTILLSAEAAQRLPEVARFEMLHRHLQLIYRAGGRMDRLIGDLLDFSRIAEHRLAIQPHTERAGDILHEAVQLSAGVASSGHVHVVEDAGGLDGRFIDADRDRILQVLSNLITNAIRFSPQGADVKVSAKPKPAGVVFEVHDEGPGVDPNDAPHIFEPFWQGREAAREGTGLGLAIAKGIIEAHGGQIWLERGEKGGATFAFSLPASSVH